MKFKELRIDDFVYIVHNDVIATKEIEKKRCTGIIFIDGALRLYMNYENSIVLTVEPNNTAYYSNYYIMFTTLKEAEAHQKKLIQEAVDKESELIMEKLREIHALREMLQE